MINHIIEEKKESLKVSISRANRELKLLEEQEKKAKTTKGIERWLGNQFESSSGLTDEFATFAREYRSEFKKAIAPEFEVVSFNRGHFYLSGFVKNKETGKLVYFSTDDVRGSGGWYNSILVRTAKHDKDFTGGSNNQTHWPNLKNALLNLSK